MCLAQVPLVEKITDEFSVVVFKELHRVANASTLAKLYGFGLYLTHHHVPDMKFGHKIGQFKDNLKNYLPSGMTTSRSLYCAGVIEIRGREGMSQVKYPAPKRIKILRVLPCGSRLEPADMFIQDCVNTSTHSANGGTTGS